MTAPERIYAGPDAVLGWDYITAEHKPWPEMCRITEYILATPEALAASPEVQALRAERDTLEAMGIRAATIAQEQRARAEAAEAKVARLVDAIGIIADDATSEEIPGGFIHQETADWHRGYDAAILKARAALSDIKEPSHD